MQIQIKCKGADYLPVAALTEFQGDLKSLSQENYARLKKQIVEDGFSAPIFVWEHAGAHKILDGHQRFKTVKQMIAEGYACETLPVVYIEADSEKQASKKLLAFASQYGKLEPEGLHRFAVDFDIDVGSLAGDFDFAGLDMDSFLEGYFEDRPAIDDMSHVKGATQAETLKKFLENDTRLMQLVYPETDFELVRFGLERIMQDRGLASHSEAVKSIVEEYVKNNGD